MEKTLMNVARILARRVNRFVDRSWVPMVYCVLHPIMIRRLANLWSSARMSCGLYILRTI
jgi:hypothetical protein